jgi:hypothetical protein
VDRFEATQKIDMTYLSTLSADAIPELVRLKNPPCLRINRDSDWRNWNLSRYLSRQEPSQQGCSPF